jgi:hypothetical protein
MFCAPLLFFDGTEGAGSRFDVLRSLTRFRWYRGRLVPFSSFALLDSFWTEPRALGPVFIFCAFGLVFGGTEGDMSRFHALRARTHFRQNGGRRVPFASFARPNSFLAVSTASSPFFKIALQDSFSVIPSASCPVFMFCAPVLIFDGTEGVVSSFHALRSRIRFRSYRGRQVACSCFALPDSFSAVPRSSSSVFMFCAPGLIFNGTEGVGSRFHVLRSPTHFLRYRGCRVPFSCFALPDSFSAVPRVGSQSHVLRARTHFRRYRGHRVPFSCFARHDSFSTLPRASSPVFMFCAPRLVFDGTEGVRSLFNVLHSRTRFGRY